MLRWIFNRGGAQLVAALLQSICHAPCFAQDVTRAAGEPWREISAGADATSSYWSAYSTSTFALLSGLAEDGVRLRTSGGYGRYRYTGAHSRSFSGETSFADVLVGYQARLGPVTAKAFAGGSGTGHRILPFDRDNPVEGLELGFKGTLELWANLGDAAWTAFDGSWSTSFDTYSTRLRAGWRLTPEVSIGLEGGLVGNAGYDGARGGVLLRYAPDWGEISATGGLSGDYDRPDQPFALVSVLLRY